MFLGLDNLTYSRNTGLLIFMFWGKAEVVWGELLRIIFSIVVNSIIYYIPSDPFEEILSIEAASANTLYGERLSI